MRLRSRYTTLHQIITSSPPSALALKVRTQTRARHERYRTSMFRQFRINIDPPRDLRPQDAISHLDIARGRDLTATHSSTSSPPSTLALKVRTQTRARHKRHQTSMFRQFRINIDPPRNIRPPRRDLPPRYRAMLRSVTLTLTLTLTRT